MPYTPITDADRAAWRAQDAAPAFSTMLDDTMTAVGAAPAAPESAPTASVKRATATARQLAGAAAIVGLVALIAFLVFRGDATPPPLANRAAPTAAVAVATDHRPPTAAPATITAYAAPDGTALGPIPADTPLKYRHSEHAGWAGVAWQGKVVWVKADAPGDLPDLAPPTPAPTPVIIIVAASPVPCDQETNPAYTAQIDVGTAGVVTGTSCDSQADAQANAESNAAQVRRANPTACDPNWRPMMPVPEACK